MSLPRAADPAARPIRTVASMVVRFIAVVLLTPDTTSAGGREPTPPADRRRYGTATRNRVRLGAGWARRRAGRRRGGAVPRRSSPVMRRDEDAGGVDPVWSR